MYEFWGTGHKPQPTADGLPCLQTGFCTAGCWVSAALLAVQGSRPAEKCLLASPPRLSWAGLRVRFAGKILCWVPPRENEVIACLRVIYSFINNIFAIFSNDKLGPYGKRFCSYLAQRTGLCISNRLSVFLVLVFGRLTNPSNSSLAELCLSSVLELSNCHMIWGKPLEGVAL